MGVKGFKEKIAGDREEIKDFLTKTQRAKKERTETSAEHRERSTENIMSRKLHKTCTVRNNY